MPASLSPHGVAMCSTSRNAAPAGKQAGSAAALGESKTNHASTHTAPASSKAPRQACIRVPMRRRFSHTWAQVGGELQRDTHGRARRHTGAQRH